MAYKKGKALQGCGKPNFNKNSIAKKVASIDKGSGGKLNPKW